MSSWATLLQLEPRPPGPLDSVSHIPLPLALDPDYNSGSLGFQNTLESEHPQMCHVADPSHWPKHPGGSEKHLPVSAGLVSPEVLGKWEDAPDFCLQSSGFLDLFMITLVSSSSSSVTSVFLDLFIYSYGQTMSRLGMLTCTCTHV